MIAAPTQTQTHSDSEGRESSAALSGYRDALRDSKGVAETSATAHTPTRRGWRPVAVELQNPAIHHRRGRRLGRVAVEHRAIVERRLWRQRVNELRICGGACASDEVHAELARHERTEGLRGAYALE